MVPLTNNLVDHYPSSREENFLTFPWIYFHRIFNCPLPQPVQEFLQHFDVCINYNFSVNYTVISKNSNI